MSSRVAAIILFAPLASLGHPRGFHKRTVVSVSARQVDVLVTMDVDEGKRSGLLRAGADADRDGSLSDAEAAELRRKLSELAVRPLKVEISGYAVRLEEREAKLSLRGERRATEEGMSVAVLATAKLPSEVTPGMSLGVEDASPDRSHVEVQVYQAAGQDAGASAPVRKVLLPGQRLEVRLGRLSDANPE
ncbi:MAG: hypothetical protein HYZ28_13440 [Myxococcales bacterium]|nr:hypothetical protein [Myxococcales bacterium]